MADLVQFILQLVLLPNPVCSVKFDLVRFVQEQQQQKSNSHISTFNFYFENTSAVSFNPPIYSEQKSQSNGRKKSKQIVANAPI